MSTSSDTTLNDFVQAFAVEFKLSDRFVARLKPILAKIMAADTPVNLRKSLLENVRVTCQTEAELHAHISACREDIKQLQESLDELCARLKEWQSHWNDVCDSLTNLSLSFTSTKSQNVLH